MTRRASCCAPAYCYDYSQRMGASAALPADVCVCLRVCVCVCVCVSRAVDWQYMGQGIAGDGARMMPQGRHTAHPRAAAGDPMSAMSMMGPGAANAAASHGGLGQAAVAAGRVALKRAREEEEEEELERLPSEGGRPRLAAPHNPHSTIPPVTEADLGAARTALNGKFPRDLINHELGDWLTRRAHQVTSAVFVKVVADVRRRVVARGDGHDARSNPEAAEGAVGEEEAAQRHYYRRKAILAFRCLPGSVGDALTFGMYVHEYGAEAPRAFRGTVMLECIDGTPLFNGETADERQHCLSAIAQAYLEFAAKEGFTEVLMRVPPPSDCSAHLFSPRSRQVRLKASEHLCHWYRRLMEHATRAGTIGEYQASRDGDRTRFPLSLLSPRDAAAEAAFKEACRQLDEQEEELLGPDFAKLAEMDRFFVGALCPPEDTAASAPDGQGAASLGGGLPLIECPLAANRHRFTEFCQQKRLYVHSIEHAQYSTMILQNEFLRQRVLRHDDMPRDEDEADEHWLHEPAAEDRVGGLLVGMQAQQHRQHHADADHVTGESGQSALDNSTPADHDASVGRTRQGRKLAHRIGMVYGQNECWADTLSSLGGDALGPCPGDGDALDRRKPASPASPRG